MTVDILIATYNGKKYLPSLFHSLKEQTHQDFHLIAVDDGSSDGTVEWLEGQLDRLPLTIYKNKSNLGVVQTFSRLMHYSKAPYVMFCDQDDVWMPQKIEKTLQVMLKVEKQTSPKTPILVHTDLEVVDCDLQPLNPSFWGYTKIKPQKTTSLNKLLIQNVVTGCTAMVNRALLEKCGPLPHGAIMHDWWLALVAAAFGRIEVIPEPTIKYRQHAGNCLGARRFFSFGALKESIRRQKKMSQQKRRQAEKFAIIYENSFSTEQTEILNQFISLSQKSWLGIIRTTVKYGFYRQGFARNFAAFISRQAGM